MDEKERNELEAIFRALNSAKVKLMEICQDVTTLEVRLTNLLDGPAPQKSASVLTASCSKCEMVFEYDSPQVVGENDTFTLNNHFTGVIRSNIAGEGSNTIVCWKCFADERKRKQHSERMSAMEMVHRNSPPISLRDYKAKLTEFEREQYTKLAGIVKKYVEENGTTPSEDLKKLIDAEEEKPKKRGPELL